MAVTIETRFVRIGHYQFTDGKLFAMNHDIPSDKVSIIDDEDSSWERISEIIDDFCRAWEDAPPYPELAVYVTQFKEQLTPGFLKIGLVELVKADLEFRGSSDAPRKKLEEYVQRWPDLASSGEVPSELLLEEYQQRLQDEGTVNLDEYETRFPKNFNQLLHLVNDETIGRTASVFRARNLNEFEAGKTIDDFDLLSKLGRGAFAVVFLARQNSMQRLVALKISADTGLEGQTLAQLDHPHIVRVFDQRTVPEENLRLMYMQYISGGSLAEVIKYCHGEQVELMPESYLAAVDQMLENAGQTRPVASSNRDWIQKASWSQLVSRLGAQIASALEYAHRNQVLHRDLKPANILVDQDGYPKLVDFNVSYSEGVTGATAATFFGGSLAYMSLEQLEAMSPDCDRQADDLTGACDVYSLGVVLFELLVGQRPFDGSKDLGPLELIASFVDERTKGLPESAKEKIQSNEFLLVDAIEQALSPEATHRITPAAMRRQLAWASNSEVSAFLAPAKEGWRFWVTKAPFVSVCIVTFVIAMFATWFIFSYNLSEAIQAKDASLYAWVRRGINIVSFNGGWIALYWLFRSAYRLLKSPTKVATFEEQELLQGIKANLNFGHHVALLFVGLWTLAGVAYPVFLTLLGGQIPRMAWWDFLGSHLLAGLTTGAYVFCGLTCCSLVVWHPKLTRMAVRRGVWPELAGQINQLRQRIAVYQVFAVATPLASIAVLVNWRQTGSSFAVGILSSAALLGLAFLGWTVRRMQSSIRTMEQMQID